MDAWARFYRAVDALRNRKVKTQTSSVSPTSFHQHLQKKLEDMPTVNEEALEQVFKEMGIGKEESPSNCQASDYEVNKIIASLNSSGAIDAYDISTKNIKKMRMSKNFCKHIKKLWNFMVHFEVFPPSLKRDKIIYIWKNKGDVNVAKFYRPITLVTGISKIMEGLLNLKIRSLVASPEGGRQQAYTPGKSIQTAVMELESKFLHVKKRFFAIVFIDLKGSFESVSHKVIHKLYSLTYKKLANITKSYLGGRDVFVYNSNFEGCNPKLS